jgi:hypothetical protein
MQTSGYKNTPLILVCGMFIFFMIRKYLPDDDKGNDTFQFY